MATKQPHDTDPLEILGERLERARERYDRHEDDFGRAAVRDALNATIEYIDTVLRPSLRRPLHRLVGALADADAGAAHPLLRPVHAPRRSLDPPERRLLKINASVRTAAQ
jgi:hypothetical protein